MKRAVLFLFCVVVSLAAEEELPLAEKCNEDLCKLPECACSSPNIPGGLSFRDTPQFVTLTFEDAVDFMSLDIFRSFLYGRRNSDGCRAGVTFFLPHEFTDYQAVNELYNQGFEIGLHSMSNSRSDEYWQEASYDDLVENFADQRKQVAHFANIPIDEIRGIRIPKLQLSGNNSYLMMKKNDLVYDSSWATNSLVNPIWPYTLDYASSQDCPKGPCPSASLPGVWVMPLAPWRDLSGNPCVMVSECVDVPDLYDSNAWYQFILANFERHYLTNRAPFGFYAHDYQLATYPAIQTALSRFLDLVNNLEDAFVVNANDVIEWIKNPVSVTTYKNKPCRSLPIATCSINICELVADHNQLYHDMAVCSNECPRVFPWLGNPLGQ
ncbi:hypothetical protein O0L34_g1739 [Tuta absoluta]|nr:hypothetical protein O0L34_g1739 [Tuta absoluta]